MTTAALLAFVSAAFAVLLAIAVLWQERLSLAHWAFAAAMVSHFTGSQESHLVSKWLFHLPSV